MTAFSRLTVATPDYVEGYDGAKLRQGVIKSKFLSAPFIGVSSRSLRRSPAQKRQQTCRLVALPNELLKMILGNLDPLWLFQVEAAYPEIRALSKILNSVWYDIMPPALFTEPEHFQREGYVAARGSETFSSSFERVTSCPRPSPLSDNIYYWRQVGSQAESLIVLPKVDKMTELSMDPEWNFDLTHPQDTYYYPLIPAGEDSFRVRNLALGGPFQPEINYRREMAGWLQYGGRCQICAKSFHLNFRPIKENYGVLFCNSCHAQYTLSYDQIQAIPGLDKLIHKSKDIEWTLHRRVEGFAQWRPFVDDVLRKQIGMDFETALAKQNYLTHLCTTRPAPRRRTEVARARLRNEIVTYAKHIWDHGSGIPELDKKIGFARTTFAPTHILQCFLFPPRSLDGRLWTVPFDDSECWLKDPTTMLFSRTLSTRTTHWKQQAAQDMVIKLCGWTSNKYYDAGRGGTVTTWIEAADEYHIQRMEKTVTADFAIQKLLEANVASYFDPTTGMIRGKKHPRGVHFGRLGVILAKLKIPPMSPVRKDVLVNGTVVEEEVLGGYQLKMAKEVYFKKLLRSCCVACPQTGLFGGRPGYAGVIKHYRKTHGQRYWASNDWLITG